MLILSKPPANLVAEQQFDLQNFIFTENVASI